MAFRRSSAAFGKAGFRQVTQCRQKALGHCLLNTSRLVPLGFDHNIHAVGIIGNSFYFNQESDHKL